VERPPAKCLVNVVLVIHPEDRDITEISGERRYGLIQAGLTLSKVVILVL
jgi:hypothetical protein